jgi:hypothetical protein
MSGTILSSYHFNFTQLQLCNSSIFLLGVLHDAPRTQEATRRTKEQKATKLAIARFE